MDASLLNLASASAKLVFPMGIDVFEEPRTIKTRSPSTPTGANFLPGTNLALPIFLPPLVNVTTVALVNVISGGNVIVGVFWGVAVSVGLAVGSGLAGWGAGVTGSMGLAAAALI